MKDHHILAYALLALVASATTACATTQPFGHSYSGGDGSSPELAIAILCTGTDGEFKAAESSWLSQHMPDARFESGNYVLGAGAYHAVTVSLPDGSRKTVYFDMPRFGRWVRPNKSFKPKPLPGFVQPRRCCGRAGSSLARCGSA